MAKETLHGSWQRKGDPADYIVVDRVYKAGHVAGFQYYKRNGQELIDVTPLRISQKELLGKYERRS